MPGQFLANGGGLDVQTSTSPTVWAAIGNISDYDLGNFQNARVDVSNLESPNNAREYRQGLQDVPEATFTMHVNATDANQQQLWTDSGTGSGSSKVYRLRLGPNTTPNFEGTAFVSTFQVTGSLDNPVTVNLGLQWEARPTATWA